MCLREIIFCHFNSLIIEILSLQRFIGAVHSAGGYTGLNKMMACAGIPSSTNDPQFKRYEQIVGQAIEKEAQDSSKRAALEERALVIDNISKLCNEL